MATNANANGIPFLKSKRLGIPDTIKDSIVLWYDIKRQGATNESMSQNPILKDLSGNGHDATCYNFAWSRMSGIGGYVFRMPLANWFKPNSNNGSYTTEGNVLHITKLNTKRNAYYVTNSSDNNNVEIQDNVYTTKSFKIKINGLPENKQVRINGVIGNKEDGQYNTTFKAQYFNNGTYTVESISVVWDNEELEPNVINYPNIFIDSDTADDVDITIEILPEYPNALVADGVDDYALVKGLPILTDYTVIAKRKWIKTEYDTFATFSSKSNSTTNGEFIFERFNLVGDSQVYSFGGHTLIGTFVENITYQTPTSYNGKVISKGNFLGSDQLSLFGLRGAIQHSNIALYSFILFDRTLTDEEIKKWIRENMDENYLLPNERPKM